MIYTVSAKLYAALFLGSILCLPAVIFLPVLIFEKIAVLYWLLLFGNAVLLFLTWHFCSSPRLSFFRGLEIITGTFMSGCGNLTQLYLFPVLFMAYGVAVAHTIAGLKNGRTYTRQKWAQTVREYEAVRGRL